MYQKWVWVAIAFGVLIRLGIWAGWSEGWSSKWSSRCWSGWFEEFGRGFALGFGVGRGGWFVFEDVEETSGCDRFRFGFDDRASRLGDGFECFDGLLELG